MNSVIRGLSLVLGGLVITMTLAFSSAVAKPITIKFSDPSSPNQARTIALKRWGDWLEKRTGNQVKFEWYWSGSLAKAKDNIKAIKGGIADMGTNSSMGYHKSLFPVWQFSELIMLGDSDWGAHSKTVKQLYETTPELKAELDKTGLKLIAIYGVHPSHFISKKPIVKLEDFEGLRIRAFGPMATWLKSIGAAPVGLTIYETYEAMQKGIVDASQSYMYLNDKLKFSEIVNYAMLPGLQNITVTMFMNKSAWDKLPADVRKVIETEGWEKLTELMIDEWDKDYAKSKQAMRDKGVTFIEISTKELDRWKNSAYKPVYAKWLGNMKDKGIDGQAILDQYSKIYKKYERSK